MDKIELTELQKKHQEEMKEKRETIKQRKARTHRLIVRGAIAENAIEGSSEMTDEQFQNTLMRMIRRSNAMAQSHLQDPLWKSPSEERTTSYFV